MVLGEMTGHLGQNASQLVCLGLLQCRGRIVWQLLGAVAFALTRS